MADTFKFPNDGYEVVVLRRQDILNCIDENIIDKEIALSIVEQCEVDAANFIKEGKWTGLPFIGNVRTSPVKKLEYSSEQQLLIKEAKEKLSKDDYVLFKTELRKENNKKVKQQRYYNYITSIAINNNKALYKKLCIEKGERYARIYLYASKHIVAIDNEFINISKYE